MKQNITWERGMIVKDEAFYALTADKDVVELMLRELENTGMCMDFLYDTDANGTRKTEEEMAEEVVMCYLSDISLIYEFKGEYASDYKTRYDYVCDFCAWEKDYFASWLEGCSDYPYLEEIKEFCENVGACIERWIYAVDQGYIDPEAGWAE